MKKLTEDGEIQETRKGQYDVENTSRKKKKLSKESFVDGKNQQEISENHIGE